jgi:hypothetical protein
VPSRDTGREPEAASQREAPRNLSQGHRTQPVASNRDDAVVHLHQASILIQPFILWAEPELTAADGPQ